MEWDNNKPLSGINVLDLSSILAGPLTGSFLSELGANVTKIENKLIGGDPTRTWKLQSEKSEAQFSAYYHSANFNKKILLVDLSSDEGQNLVHSILKETDIVISNFQKKVAQKLLLEPHQIANQYPNLIFVQLNAYSYDDPKPGYDLVMQGETGWLSMTGIDEKNIAKLPVALIDIIAAHQMKEAILLALYKKARTKTGSIIHVSLYQSSISALANQASNYLNQGHIPKPLSTLHPNIAPYGDIFYTQDDVQFLLAIGSDAQFKKLWDSFEHDKQEFTLFEENKNRVIYRKKLQLALQKTFNNYDIETTANILNKENLPFCLVQDLKTVFENNLAKEMIKESITEDGNKKYVSQISFILSNIEA